MDSRSIIRMLKKMGGIKLESMGITGSSRIIGSLESSQFLTLVRIFLREPITAS